jgi:hypothetical protein
MTQSDHLISEFKIQIFIRHCPFGHFDPQIQIISFNQKVRMTYLFRDSSETLFHMLQLILIERSPLNLKDSLFAFVVEQFFDQHGQLMDRFDHALYQPVEKVFAVSF